MKKRWFAIVLLVLIVAVFGYRRFRGPTPPPAEPLPEITKRAREYFPELADKLAAFSTAREALTTFPDINRALALPIDPYLPNVCDRPIFLSIYLENSPPLWGVGTAACLPRLGLEAHTNCLHDALLCAAHQITQQEDFKKFYMLKQSEITMRLDIVDRLAPLDLSPEGQKNLWIEPGYHGLVLQNGNWLTYLPPFAFLIKSWEEEDRSTQTRVSKHLEELAASARIGRRFWKRFPIYRFNTYAILQHRPDFQPLDVLRDAPIIRSFGSREIGRAAIDAGRYLKTTFDYQMGRFRYFFNPITIRSNSHFNYDMVSHAGSLFAMFKLYKDSRKEEFFDVCQLAFDHLVRHVDPPLLAPELLSVRHKQMARLGASALLLLALTELPDKFVDRVGLDRLNALTRFLIEMQMPNGRFYDFHWQQLLGYTSRRPNLSFQGVTLLALVRYYRINNTGEWLHAARRAADYQIDYFMKHQDFDHWTVQGLAELYYLDPDPRYAETCFAMADLLLAEQWGNPVYKNPPYRDYLGGFSSSRPPRTLTAAKNIQALVAAHWLAYRLAKNPNATVHKDPQPYSDAVVMATLYLLQNQYRRDNTYYLNLTEDARGAFRSSLVDPMILLNANEHAILALTGAYDVQYLRETGEPPKEFEGEGTDLLQSSKDLGRRREEE